MSLRLRIEHGQDAGTTYRLPTAGVYTLGRVPQNSVRVLDMKVSKTHCELRVSGSDGNLKAVLHDPGSTHGCELNGQPVPKGKDLPMRPGDELRLGLTILRLLSAGDADQDAKPVEGRTVEAGAEGDSKESAATPTLPADDLVGKKLGGYQVEKKIGAGGMGGVYLAEQVSLNRKVALKVLNETFAADSAFVDQFVNEARAAGALNHPNVVQVYDVGSDQGQYFFSMEVMPGGSIEEKLREGPIAWEDGLNYFIDAANALIFANKREILHRDVKPDNLMISEDDSAKLCDLGLAKKSEVSDLMDQGIIGTPHFISPEAIRRKPDIDHRTDLYSLGCSFYRIFTGKNPYAAGTVKEILLGHLNKPVPHINALNRDVPKEIDEVVARLMAKEPDERIQTPDELLRELDKIRTKYNLEAHGIKPASRKPLVFGGVAAAIAIGIAIWFATRPTEVQVTDLTPEQKAAQERAKRALEEKKLSDVVRPAATRYNEVYTRYIGGMIDDDDNWKKPLFTTLSSDAKKDSETWSTQVETWRGDKAKVKDPQLVAIYDTAINELDELAAKMRKIHTDIEATKKTRKRFEKQINDGKRQAKEDAERLIGDFGRKLKGLFDKDTYDDWIELEKTVRSDELDGIVKELLGRKVDRFPLIDQKTIDEILKKHAPLTKKDAPRGIRFVDQAKRSIDGRRSQLVNAVNKLMQQPPSHKTFTDAKKLVTDFLATLPAGFDASQAEAPVVVAALKQAKETAEKLLERLKTGHATFQDREYRADRGAYFELARALWNPEEGSLQRFDFKAAKGHIEAAQGKLKVGSYQTLAGHWMPLTVALERLFERITAAHDSDGWVDDDFLGLDRRGKLKKMRIRGIGPDGVKWEKDPVPFHTSTPRFLLDNLFFVNVEDEPTWTTARLKSCDASDHAALGLLAELAGRYDVASKQYMQGASAEGDLGNAVRARLTQLEGERQAAEKFFAILAFAGRLDAWAEPFQAYVKELAGDPDAFPSEERQRLIAEKREFEKTMAQMRANLDDLLEREDLGRTMWGSAMRDEIHPKAAYAGEVIPDAPKKQPRGPAKDDAGKGEGGKDDAGKDDAGKGDDPTKDGAPKKGDAPKKDDAPKKGDAEKNGGGAGT